MDGWKDEWEGWSGGRLGIATGMYLPVLEVPGVQRPGVSGCATVSGPCTGGMLSPGLGTCTCMCSLVRNYSGYDGRGEGCQCLGHVLHLAGYFDRYIAVRCSSRI